MSRVELYERIRKDNREGLSIRALAAKHHVHRRTVREALASSVPPGRKTPEREATALGPWMMIIRAWLVADRDAPRKQRQRPGGSGSDSWPSTAPKWPSPP